MMKRIVVTLSITIMCYGMIIGAIAIYAQSGGGTVSPGGRPKYEEVFSRFFFGEKTYSMDESLQHSRTNENIYSINDYVGIGTLAPTQILTVDGNILVTGDVCTFDGKCLNDMH